MDEDEAALQAAIAMSLQTHAQDQTTDQALNDLYDHVDRAKRETAVNTLLVYINNVVQNPADPKYRSIRKSNKAFIERVAAVQPAIDLLKSWGWVEGDEFWTLPDTVDLPKTNALLSAFTKKFNVSLPRPAQAGQQANSQQQKQIDALRKAQEERARIKQLMMADRQEVATNPTRPSHAVQMRGGGNTGRESSPGAGASGEVLHISSEAEYQRLISSSSLVVVDFYATWCGPCKMIAPHIEQMARSYPHVIFAKVDVDELQTVAISAGVTAMPTFHLYRNGKKLREMRGANPGGLEQMVHELA
eukprot:comp23582_c1_seq1/m.39984 comp23582_c1_seq1/g.39984  ORF comp23582_c1_seq1/g.39984 comp23582_c1_seq1/m.39984 type:complete len:303 (-) comp23582_c1_seq1:332-1240(-)